jgi:hypothetical protein
VALEPVDIAVFVGLGEPYGASGTRYVQVARADLAPSAAVAGVVKGRYNAQLLLLEDPDPESLAALEETGSSDRQREPKELWVTRAVPSAPEDFLLLVTHGPAEVRASAVVSGAIDAGDLLTVERGTALAIQAPTTGETAPTARVIGTALGTLPAGQAAVWAFVRPQ